MNITCISHWKRPSEEQGKGMLLWAQFWSEREKVVARGRNLVNSTSDPTAHAETVALRHAGERLGYTDFSELTLYTTFEPCPMCCGAILASGVHTLVMGARHNLAQSRWGAYTVERLLDLTNRTGQLIVITGVLTQACADVRMLETK